MRCFKSQKLNSGFSLVELMIVVGIIGVLATLALPSFKRFQIKAKMAEARTIITFLYTLEHSYQVENNLFIDMAAMGAGPASISGNNVCDAAANPGATALGFHLDPCNSAGPIPRYYYRVTGASSSQFVASGSVGNIANNRVCPGNNHHWIGMNQDKSVYGTYPSNNPFNSNTTPDLTVEAACPN